MTVTYRTAIALKKAGFPQPEFIFGQIWIPQSGAKAVILASGYFGRKGCTYEFNTGKYTFMEESSILLPSWSFAPTLDEIAPFLPEGFALEIWDGQPSCTNRDDSNPIRTTGENFAEAAAKMWLEIAAFAGTGQIEKET